MNTPLRRTRADLVATGAIAALSAVAVAAAVVTAPIRDADLAPAAQELTSPGELSSVPATLTESFRRVDDSPNARPLVAEGLIITHADATLTATTPEGETAWTYTRDAELCSLAEAWGKVVATYRGPAGCGDVVAIAALTGQYAGTRSAPAPDHVSGISSNDRVGYTSPSRTELWRSDLVRTVEYGAVEAPQESGMQPHQCTQTSALTRTEFLAVTEECGDGTYLRLQAATPEDARAPEIAADVTLPAGSYLVAVGQHSAAVYDPTTSRVTSYNDAGEQLWSGPAPVLADNEGPLREDATGDLPHHMTYSDGTQLLFFDPADLRLSGTFDGALGTGVAAGDRLLVATDGGIAVVDWDSATAERIIPVDRAEFTGPVSVASAGAGVVEKRGSEVVYLAAN
ncbi:hypothetical protein [Corynebacterium timonense]|uniref:PQQ-like domain-containing protein n=1 Tax=Corynebacterium timonense TaxID=441500 RepID=A0A1H1RNW9_9CORY|nr:hypothetical protein [Corynebacterium timonense]SDS37395.1 hypothetical protein SAMN04488539_1548 [Corynebacterium timonense]